MRAKKFIFLGIILSLLTTNSAFCWPQNIQNIMLDGGVQKDDYLKSSKRVVDSETGMPISGAIVSIPTKGISTQTDENGSFKLNTNLSKPVIMSVRKKGYKPFSLTVNKNSLSKPFTLAISKQKINEIVIDADLRHLGDNNFSTNSANATDFRLEASGPSFTKSFFVKTIKPGQQTSIVIGSIIGLDTDLAKRLNQNHIMFARSSPAELFVNSQKVGEIKVNGDNQEIRFSPRLLIPNSHNKITLKTGYNLDQHSYTDYDDIEIMNLFLEIK